MAGAGTRRDSITFASVCVPFECHAQDLAADDFPASLERAAHHILNTKRNNPDDDDDPFEFIEHPERQEKHDLIKNRTKAEHSSSSSSDDIENDDPSIWWHVSPDRQREWTNEYINLHQRIAKLNDFLQTGWTCGSYRVPWHVFPFGLPYLLICAVIIGLTILGTIRPKTKLWCKRQKRAKRRASRTVLIETDESERFLFQQKTTTPFLVESKETSATSSLKTSTNPNHEATGSSSSASLSSDASGADTNKNQTNQNLDSDRTQATATKAKVLTEDKSIIAMWNIYTNWNKLCSSRHEATACLDGLRVFSILWVILGHVMAIQSSTGGGYSNPVDFLPPNGFTTTFFGQIIFASRFAVDTFLAISGYLLVIVISRKAPSLMRQQADSSSNESIPGVSVRTFFRLIGLRLLRILPLYGICLGFYTQVAPHLYLGGDDDSGGPFWYQWNSLLSPCREFGWTNWLFVNNFIPFDKSNTETCFYHSWYLAVDMQLFILFGLPVTLFVFLKNPSQGRRLTLGLWWASVLLTAYLSYVRHWSINTFDGLQVARFDVEGYAKPHVRGQAYFAGMYVAMVQLTKGGPNINSAPTRKHHLLLWTAIFALGLITFVTVTGAYARRPCQYSEFPSRDHCGSLWSAAATFLYTGFSRAVWSCGIAVLMTLCLEGNGGWLNKLLSWRIWAPLSQLSFGAYLIHPIVIFVWLLGERQKNTYSLMTFGMSLISVCVVSFACSLAASLLVEIPLATVVSRKLVKKTQRPSSTDLPDNQPASTAEMSREVEKLELLPSQKQDYGSGD